MIKMYTITFMHLNRILIKSTSYILVEKINLLLRITIMKLETQNLYILSFFNALMHESVLHIFVH